MVFLQAPYKVFFFSSPNSSRVILKSPSLLLGNDSILFPLKEKQPPASKQSLLTLRDVCLRKMISDFVFFLALRFSAGMLLMRLRQLLATGLSNATTPNERYALKCHSTDGLR